MKSIFIITMTLLITKMASASPSQLGNVTDESFALMRAEQALSCYHYDKNKDGIKETSSVSIDLGRAISKPMFLSNNYISNEFADLSGEICKKIDKIIELSPMSFGVTDATLNSVLVHDRAALVEHISITIGTKGEVWGLDGLETVDTEITLTETVSKELNR